MNYEELKQAVEGWIERDDLDDYWNTITQLAEAEINDDFVLLTNEKTLEMTVNGTLIDLPDDFIQMRTIRDQFTVDGEPCGYEIMGGEPKQLLLSDDIYIGDKITIYYFAKDPSLTINSTSSLLNKYPNVVLWKFCEHAVINVQEPDAAALFAGRYTTARSKIYRADFRTRVSGKAGRPRMQLP